MICVILAAGLSAYEPASAQTSYDEEPILPADLSNADVTMRGRYARQWKQADGTLVVVMNGGFRLDFGPRRLVADNAVVWLHADRDEDSGAKVYNITCYLSGRATVLESAGTLIEDSVLLISNIRTSGEIIKYQDAHSPEPLEDSPFYEQAVRDRELIESRTTLPVAGRETETRLVEVARPRDDESDRARRVITYQFGNIEPARTSTDDTVEVVTGGVYIAQAGTSAADALEIRADSAVVFAGASAARAFLGEAGEETPADREVESDVPDAAPPPDTPLSERPYRSTAEAVGDETAPLFDTSQIAQSIRAVYLEGDVVLTAGNRFIRASRLYYDFEHERALILDGVLRADLPERGVPLYVRADEIRQLSARDFSARNARVSTSEFFTPHYHVGVEKITIHDQTGLDSAGHAVEGFSGTYESTNSTLNVGGVPLFWWPYSRGDYKTTETLLRRVRMSYSNDFGATVETTWKLFDLLGVEAPPGYDADLELDYLGKRGPAIGVDMDYRAEDHFGMLRNYYIRDEGEDDLGPLRDNTPDTKDRGRFLWRHRHYLPQDWEATIEIAYITDPGFMEQFRRSEWFEEKDYETAIYLKRAQEVDAITFLANWRLLDFVTQTEHLPELAYRRIGDTFLSPLVLYHESRIGGVRYRPDDRHFLDRRTLRNDGLTDTTLRADAREELELPIKLPDFNVVPFASFRGSYWDGQPLDDGGLWRGFGLYGVRGSGYLARVFDDVESDLLDIHRIRHVIQPHFAVWWSHSNARSDLITPFDEGIETIDDFYGSALGVKQTWQTKRGPLDDRRTVDLLTLDLEAGFFGDRQPNENTAGYVNTIRPEDSRTRNYLAGDLQYRISDRTTFLYDFNIDLNDWSYDRHNLALAIQRLPRLSYVVGWRHAGDLDLDLLGGGYNYKLNEKHSTAMRIWYDVDHSSLGELTFSYVRRLPRWYFAFTFEVDEVFDDVSFSVSMWPEGIPEWTIGNRRFTELAETTAIRP